MPKWQCLSKTSCQKHLKLIPVFQNDWLQKGVCFLCHHDLLDHDEMHGYKKLNAF